MRSADDYLQQLLSSHWQQQGDKGARSADDYRTQQQHLAYASAVLLHMVNVAPVSLMQAVLAPRHEQQQQQQQQYQEKQQPQQQQQQQLRNQEPEASETGCRHLATHTMLPQLLMTFWSSSSNMHSIATFFSAVAAGCAGHHSVLEQLILSLLQCMSNSVHSSSSSAAGQQRSNTSGNAVALAGAAVTALQAICSRLLPHPGQGICHPVLLPLLMQQQHLQQLLHGVGLCYGIKLGSQLLGAVLLRQLLQVEEIAAQQHMTAALHDLLAAALELRSQEAVNVLRSILHTDSVAGSVRRLLLQHGLPAILALIQHGEPSTAWEGAWLLLNNFAAAAVAPEIMVQQDCSFLLEVMLGQQQQLARDTGTARGSDAVAAVGNSGSSARADNSSDAPRLRNATSASVILSGLARQSDAWLPLLATSSNIKLLLLGVLPPDTRVRVVGSTSTVNNISSSSSSSGYWDQFSDKERGSSAAASTSAARAAVWSDFIAETNTVTCRHLARSPAGVSAICEHLDLLLAATKNTDALEAATIAAQLLRQVTGTVIGIDCLCSDSRNIDMLLSSLENAVREHADLVAEITAELLARVAQLPASCQMLAQQSSFDMLVRTLPDADNPCASHILQTLGSIVPPRLFRETLCWMRFVLFCAKLLVALKNCAMFWHCLMHRSSCCVLFLMMFGVARGFVG
jgi:hypothetical protein